MELFHNKVWIKKGDEVVICGNVNNFDKRFKEYKTTKKKHGILEDFHLVGIIDMDGKKWFN